MTRFACEMCDHIAVVPPEACPVCGTVGRWQEIELEMPSAEPTPGEPPAPDPGWVCVRCGQPNGPTGQRCMACTAARPFEGRLRLVGDVEQPVPAAPSELNLGRDVQSPAAAQLAHFANVSRHHLVVWEEGGDVWIRDESRNGTFLIEDGSLLRLEKRACCKVAQGTTIQLGNGSAHNNARFTVVAEVAI